MRRARRWPFGVAAIGAHVALALSIPAFVDHAPPIAAPDELAFELLDTVVEPEDPPVDVTPTHRGEPPPRPRRASIAATPIVGSSAEVSAGVLEPGGAVEPEESVTPEAEPSDLAPSAVALAFLPLTGEPSRPQAPQTEREEGVDERALEGAISADLGRIAMTKGYVSSHEIELRARTDGSYVHEGNGFTATIRPDGTVAFEDRAGLTADGLAGSMPVDGSGRSVAPDGSSYLPELLTAQGGLVETTDPPVLSGGIRGTFDLQGELMRAHGDDPWGAERQRFLEETEALRDELTDRHAAEVRARALRRLPARVSRIWRDRTRTAVQRRAAIFELWDACAEDEDGSAARARIEAFVCEHLPAGSPDAFTSEELRTLSAGRDSTAPFAPYH